MPALSDSLPETIGIDTSMSQALATTRERPRPSEPTTSTIGPSAIDMSRRSVVPSASSPATKKPAFLYPSIARVRLTACATGIRASAPAEAFHAPAVTPADRRDGTDHAGRAERRGGPHHGSEVPRVGHAVKRDDERESRPLSFGKILGMCVLVGAHPQRDALVDRAARQPVKLGRPRLKYRDPRLRRQLHGLRDPLVLLRPARDVQGHRGNPRAQ